ncbi:MAG: DegT/DnrJ/EryC1/StrS family aminotransferase, partial [Acidobacteriota bacterium]|nr:DegT/DnrJ/EryC1/StrS family aminotransferase [Acidobacteriota bacterium]
LLHSGNYVLTKEVQHFEAAFARFCTCAHARGVNSGTDALIIALRALGVESGDDVITQANTFHATVAAIVLAGARPVLVDAVEDTFLMNTAQVEAAITTRTRVIIPVHLYGKPTPMRELLSIAERDQILLIEDAAQAHGAEKDGQRVGSFGAAGCFSFHPSKNLAAAGDAGAIVTNSKDLAGRIDLYRSLGQAGQNNHVVVGLNSKLDSLQALILQSKLDRLDDWNQARNRVADSYRARLADAPVSFQSQDARELHVYHLFQMRTPRRDALLQYLRSEGVDAVVRYPQPVHLQPAFAGYGWRPGQFPIAETLARELVCLPIRPDMDEGEVAFVTSKVKQFFANVYAHPM